VNRSFVGSGLQFERKDKSSLRLKRLYQDFGVQYCVYLIEEIKYFEQCCVLLTIGNFNL